ncbi:hypothetical protein [Plastoroseomonas hellenica]|uniref:hypothetical protein n=1 Tax=Plastoroseomonas hellenica TaxID=2687306 RepID=UPI001BA94E97|nr:hypothetical protein [Plastoroseomonas hellenica]MBR0641226.1 hypothetical protein [Plastoroseomonas hellenica]
MDGIAPVGGSSAAAVEAAREELQHRIEALRRAMVDFGVRPGHPEAVLFGAMISTQMAFGDMALEMGRTIDGVIAAARELNESDLERLREATTLADLTTRQAKGALIAAEVEQQRAVGQVVKTMAPQLTEILRDTVVLKEWRHNKRLNLLFRAKVVGLAILLVVGGYALRTWETWDATASIARCMASAERNTAGRLYCPLDAMTVAAALSPG